MRITPGHARARLRSVAAGALLLVSAACGSRRAPPPVRAALPEQADAAWRDIHVCVVDEQGIRDVPARYNPVTRDTLVDGRPFAEAYPMTAKYAAGAGWYVDNEPFERGRYWYVKYALPRVVRPHEIVPAGEHAGVLAFKEAAEPDDPPLVLYVALRPGCEFQMYQRELIMREGEG